MASVHELPMGNIYDSDKILMDFLMLEDIKVTNLKHYYQTFTTRYYIHKLS